MIFTGISWYVAPDGSPRGDGSSSRPWDIATALCHPPEVEPGDVIWLAGGVYRLEAPLEVRLSGTLEQPIQAWGDPDDEPAVLDFADGRPHAIYLGGSHAWYGDFEIRCSSASRWSETEGSEGNPRGTGVLAESGPGVRLLRITVRDFGTTMFESQPSGIEIIGCTFRDSYWDAPDRSHGPGLYIRNPRGAPRKRIIGNVIFQHGRQGIQGFGSTPFSEMDVIGNTLFNNGIAREGFHRNFMFGNATDDHWNVVIQDNVAYFPAGKRLGHEANMAGGDGGSHGLVLEGNWIAHEKRPALRVNRAEAATITENRILGDVTFSNLDETVSVENEGFGAQFPQNTLFYGGARPDGVWIRTTVDHTLPDAWQRWNRATVTILNWDAATEVALDLSSLPESVAPQPGTLINLSPVQSPSEILELAYDGTPITAPMSGWDTDWPAGRAPDDALPATFPELGVFDVRWPAGGDAAAREHVRLPDPGKDLPEQEARTQRENTWQVQDSAQRDLLRAERIAYWRSQSLGRSN